MMGNPTLKINKEEFLQWMATCGLTDIRNTGRRCATCPIANYLNYLYPDKEHYVDGNNAGYLDASAEYGYGPPIFYLPKWVRPFVRFVDRTMDPYKKPLTYKELGERYIAEGIA